MGELSEIAKFSAGSSNTSLMVNILNIFFTQFQYGHKYPYIVKEGRRRESTTIIYIYTNVYLIKQVEQSIIATNQ